MKICILTQPLKSNYGGLLQAYALQTVLKRMGHEVVTDQYGVRKYNTVFYPFLRFGYHFFKRYIRGDKSYHPFSQRKYNEGLKKISIHTNRFVEQYIATTKFFHGHSPRKEIIQQIDALIVGSDQVWRAAYNNLPTYFLDFPIPVNIRRIAYAASFGFDTLEG